MKMKIMKSYKNQSLELDKSITILEQQRKLMLVDLKQQLNVTYESLRPINVINATIDDIRNSTELKNNVLETVVSVAGGYASKMFLVGKSNSIFKKIFGALLQYGATNLISNKVHKKIIKYFSKK